MEVLKRVSDQKKHSMLLLFMRPAASATLRLLTGIKNRAGVETAMLTAITDMVMAKRATSIVVGSTPCRMRTVASGGEKLKASVEQSTITQPNRREGTGAARCEASVISSGICLKACPCGSTEPHGAYC